MGSLYTIPRERERERETDRGSDRWGGGGVIGTVASKVDVLYTDGM